MTWPNTQTTNSLDADSDTLQNARPEVKGLADKFNLLVAHVTTVMQGLLSSATAADARNTLDVPARNGAGASGTWGISISGAAASVTNGVYTVGDQEVGGKKTFSGFTKLGTSAPALQCRKVTGTTAGAEGFGMDIAHSIADVSKVVGVSVMVYDSLNAAWIHAGHTTSTERQFDWRLTGTHLRIINSATNSGSILSAPVKALLWVEE